LTGRSPSETIGRTHELTTDEPLDVRLSFDETAYEVRQLGDIVGQLEWLERKSVAMRAEAMTASWRFVIGRNGRSWMGIAEDETSGSSVAGYYPRWRRGRAIAFDDEEWYRMRAPVLGTTWRLRAPERAPVARLRTAGSPAFVERVDLAARAASVTNLPLLVLFAIWTVLAEPLSVPIGTGP